MNARYSFLIYTLEEGGEYHILHDQDGKNKRRFKSCKETGVMSIIYDYSITEKTVRPKFICLVKEIDNFDFIINRKR